MAKTRENGATENVSTENALMRRLSKLPYYRVDMQIFVGNVSTHSSQLIHTVLCVDVQYRLQFGFTIIIRHFVPCR